MINYKIEIYDTCWRRILVVEESPLLEAVRSGPDAADVVHGLLPVSTMDLAPGYRIRVIVGGNWFCDAVVTRISSQWSDTRKLILDRYVNFHEVIEFEAMGVKDAANTAVSRAFTNRPVSAIVKSIINSAPGPVHYRVAHAQYSDGAQREYQKFLARKTPANQLEAGGISSGQWVDGSRISLHSAYAKDGDTIAGLMVNGVDWPDVRLMLIDSEEVEWNSHAVVRHPEVANWSRDRYAMSGYKVAADKATQALQALIDACGIDYIELNPHQDETGAFDDRIDMYGRYLGLIYGGGLCFNAAQVEQGHADVYLWEDGKYLVPEMELKDFYSYVGRHDASIQDTTETLATLDLHGGALEAVTALAYAAGGYVWSLDPDWAVAFSKKQTPDRVIFVDPAETGIALGADATDVANAIYFAGNPITGGLDKTYRKDASIGALGFLPVHLNYFSMSVSADAGKLVNGLLDDVAYPVFCGLIQFYHGDASVAIGDVIELRGETLRRINPPIDGEWGGRYAGKNVGRVNRITHRFTGKEVATIVELTSPLRSVARPAAFLAKSQGTADSVYQFRADDASVGLDAGYHLD